MGIQGIVEVWKIDVERELVVGLVGLRRGMLFKRDVVSLLRCMLIFVLW